MITEEQYQDALKLLKNIKREDIYVNDNPLWISYKKAIETKVRYEIEKELK